MFMVFRHCLLRLGEGTLVGSNLTVRAHHPLIEKVQSLINNKTTQKEPEEDAGGKGTAAEVNPSPATVDPHHSHLQQDAVRAQTGGTKRHHPTAVADPTLLSSLDSTTAANSPEGQHVSRDAVPAPAGESMMEQLITVPQWATTFRPPPSLGGDSDKEESCSKEELRSVLRDLHNYRYDRTSLHLLNKVSRLVFQLKKYRHLSNDVWEEGGVPLLMKLSAVGSREVQRKALLALALVGHAPPYAKQGLRILTIDGGGTRAIIPITILRQIERKCDTDLFKQFDLICGTSSGALVAAYLGVMHGDCQLLEQVCRRLGTDVFTTKELSQKVAGISNLFFKHAFYDSKKYEKLLKSYPGLEQTMIDTAAEEGTPKVLFVSTIANWPAMEPHVFRNYNHPPGAEPHYRGCSSAILWEALRASSAAPGFFEEVKLEGRVHHDGALLTNNPTAVALHEARLLWGKSVPIQCIISLGTGKWEGVWDEGGGASQAGLKDKLFGVASGATDTEAVHAILKDVLPPSTYHRFNPTLPEAIPIDECSTEQINRLVQLTEEYLAAGLGAGLDRAVAALQQDKTRWMTTKDKAGSMMSSLQHWVKRKTQTGI